MLFFFTPSLLWGPSVIFATSERYRININAVACITNHHVQPWAPDGS